MEQDILSPPNLSPLSRQHNDSATNISNQSPSTSEKSRQHNDSATNISNQSQSKSHQHKPSPTQSTPKKKDRFGDQIEKSLDKNVRRMKK